MKYCFGRSYFRNIDQGIEREWILGNGLGGYASSTIIGASARSHHNYLNVSLNYPVDRFSILSKTNEILEFEDEVFDLSSQTYVNYNKNGQEYLNRFILDESVPTYEYGVRDIIFKKTICMEYGKNTVVVCYDIKNGNYKLKVRIIPLFTAKVLGGSCERSELLFETCLSEHERILTLNHNKFDIKFFSSDGEFYDRKNIKTSLATPNFLIEENVLYNIDNRNGFLGLDNFFTPYEVNIHINPYENRKFYIKCTVEDLDFKNGFDIVKDYKNRISEIYRNVQIKDEFVEKLVHAGDHFIVKRNSTNLKTVLAGFPWFTDWGRDTMIAFHGLTLCTKRFEDAREILESFARYEKNGLIPNVFPDKSTDAAVYNTVDASLWYFYAVDQYLKYTGDFDFVKCEIYPVLERIIENYINGTYFSIKMEEDSLISAGSDLDQVTWMDVRVGDFVITPRHGKPVEINALWYNAIKVMENLSYRFSKNGNEYERLSRRVKESFNNKFWNDEQKCLKDVVDEDDLSIRPNQIWAVFLPYTMLSKQRAMEVVNKVHAELYTPYGLRSLSYKDHRYRSKYIGKLIDRDLAYHMGTVWGFLIGGFITSYCKVNDYKEDIIDSAKEMCEIFLDNLNDGCINGVAEIFDGDFPCTSRGCFTQAWSVGEILRVYVCDLLRL